MDISEEQLLRGLQDIDEYEFERLVADLWEEFGWETTVTQASNDRGIDVIAEKFHPVYQKHLIQAKRYSSKTTVGSQDIQQYSSLKHQKDNVSSVVVVTTGEFTNPAKEAVNGIDHMKIIDGSTLVSMIDGLESDIVDDYINVGDKAGSKINHIQYCGTEPTHFESIDKGLENLLKRRESIAFISSDGYDLGYSIHPRMMDSYYNVHAFFETDGFDVNDIKNIKKTAAELNLNVIPSEGNTDIHVGKIGNEYPDIHEIRSKMRQFLRDIYSLSLEEASMIVQSE